MAALNERPEYSLAEGLSDGIRAVAALHSDTCDLTDRGTPCAAVGILRTGDEIVESLALSDVSVVVETLVGPQVTCDLAIEELCGTEPATLEGLRFDTPDHKAALAGLVECQTKTRNQPNGWWVAAADPQAAFHAKTNIVARETVSRMAVFSDGATRPVDQMNLYDWPQYVEMLEKLGPARLIEHVRQIESDDPVGERFPRTKRHDDATIASWTL